MSVGKPKYVVSVLPRSDPLFDLMAEYDSLKRDSWGHSYLIVRGEIQGLMKDKQLRKHLSRMFSLINNERGLKTIRYRCSPNHKLSQLGIGGSH